jgi:outer membrane protein
MSKAALLLLGVCLALRAEEHTLTLAQAVEAALRQNPDIALARLDAEKARLAVKVAKDPFLPRVSVGSGWAYTSGYPMSIDGSAPSIVQAQAQQYLFNRQQTYVVAQTREEQRGAAVAATGKRDEVAFQTATLYLDAERAIRVGKLARQEVESLEKMLAAAQSQVEEGRALPLAAKQAAVALARSRQTVATLDDSAEAAEAALAIGIGLTASDRVRPALEERGEAAIPATAAEALNEIVAVNSELLQLRTGINAQGLAARAARAARLPRVDLVAQYGLFAKYNHWEDYFTTFQRHNGELGVSVQMPILFGPGTDAQAAQASVQVTRLRTELTRTRNRLQSEVENAYRDLKTAGSGVELARLDLDASRELVSLNLALNQEGRLSNRDLEQARAAETEKWAALYDAQYAAERIRLSVLRLTGRLVAGITSHQ